MIKRFKLDIKPEDFFSDGVLPSKITYEVWGKYFPVIFWRPRKSERLCKIPFAENKRSGFLLGHKEFL